jgi:translation initiation factor IF-3
LYPSDHQGEERPITEPDQSRPRVNSDISAQIVRVLGPEGEALGVQQLVDAAARARVAGLDLVEVAPDAQPPVCRIMDYDQYLLEAAARRSRGRRLR